MRTRGLRTFGRLPLREAYGAGVAAAAGWLVEEGADIDQANQWGETQLFTAC